MFQLAGILSDIFVLFAWRRMFFTHLRLLQLQDKQNFAHIQSPVLLKGSGYQCPLKGSF
ncbi:hypothetical protein KL86DPRO_40076 [uncultured delta proteobacterium]|uniref:Uncharacterized protein n=1 Tax=uncultured delta proteobacterium TaxID=34034 RepID=A0A212K9C5_9DELT|nr:hypothetical protein KL86DPRO_40076 [uncultured delta proteobacterium]